MSYIVVSALKLPNNPIPAVMVHITKTEEGAKGMVEFFKKSFPKDTEVSFSIIHDGENND
jgi:hypothetical protein